MFAPTKRGFITGLASLPLVGCTAGFAPKIETLPTPSLDQLAQISGRRLGSAVAWNADGTGMSVTNPRYAALLKAECGLIVPENEMKWQTLRPSADTYDFAAMDEIAKWAMRHDIGLRAHVLLWHRPEWFPDWLNTYDFGPNPAREAERLLVEHIDTVTARYADQIKSWDVVNEAIDHDRRSPIETSLSRAMGSPEAVIDLAFHAARERMPQAQLVYNDYMSWEPAHAGHMSDVLRLLEGMKKRGVPESGTNTGPAQISERTLREMFFPPFKEVIDRTAIDAVMASYNEIDGIPSHSNKWLLEDILRGEWNYDGAIVSDYFAIEEMVSRHKIASEIPSAAKLAMDAGIDIDFPDGASYKFLEKLLEEGRITQTQIDTAVERILTMKFNAGLFEQPFVIDSAPALASNGPEGVALARKAAEKSLILLKNDGALPLSLSTKSGDKPTLAVIGPNSDVARLGGYYGIPRNTVSPLDGIRAAVGDRADIVHAEGVQITLDDDWWEDEVELADPAQNRRMIAEAVETARGADTIVLFVGDTEQTSREGWADSHLGDRTSLDLVGEQNELFAALHALGKPIVTVLVNGRPPSYPQVVEKSDAVLETWYAGEQQGNAIADALLGRINPGGKLPVTVARNAGQLPNFYNHKPSARRGYLFDQASPLFPFGFGLSYTRFDIGEPILSSSTIRAGDGVTVRVPVTNTGEISGDEVVQVYLRDAVSSVTRPVKELVGFARVTLAPGQSKMVDIAIRPDAFAFWNRDMERVVEPGEFTIMVGPNSADFQESTLTVSE